MQFLLLKNISVQNANAIAGFTWGFPAITHFLGFAHNLSRKLSQENFSGIGLGGCGVISHSIEAHTFGKYEQSFTQHRYQPYLHDSNKKSESPPIIEEGKMNMKVSLIIEVNGNVGNKEEDFLNIIERCCFTQKLAGGTILSIEEITLSSDQKKLKRKLMPGFALIDRSAYLEQHFKNLQIEDPESNLLQAWLDFSAIKQAARPVHHLISKHLKENHPELFQEWEQHISVKPYSSENIPKNIRAVMDALLPDRKLKKLTDEWKSYCSPTEKTAAQWELLQKPFEGYLVPLITGYKAISKVYENHEIKNTRDNETPVCFVESVHSVGEWMSPHRIDKLEDLLWSYHYEENWYLCKQVVDRKIEEEEEDDL